MKTAYYKGFTLIELMVTIAVLGILLALAAPSFQSTIRNNRIAAISNDLISALNLARSEAVKRGRQVTVCKVANPSATAPACSTSGNWAAGWQVFVDEGTVGTVDGTDARIKIGQPSNANVTITADASLTNYVSYLPSGFSSTSGNWVVCMQGIARTISISNTGRVRITPGTC